MYNSEPPKKEMNGCLQYLLYFGGFILAVYFLGFIYRTFSNSDSANNSSSSQDNSSYQSTLDEAKYGGYRKTASYQATMEEGDRQFDELCESDPCCHGISEGLPPDIACNGSGDYSSGNSGSTSSGCPSGCKTHIAGCDIKGNVEFNTGEKIYHLFGMTFYNDTVINPDYGERWFCTEAEAKANGWRKASN